METKKVSELKVNDRILDKEGLELIITNIEHGKNFIKLTVEYVEHGFYGKCSTERKINNPSKKFIKTISDNYRTIMKDFTGF